MLKSFAALVSISCLMLSCAAPSKTSAPQASASGAASGVSAVDAAPHDDSAAWDTVWVPPPTGSLLGGGYVRVPKKVTGTDENALLGNINLLNAAAGSRDERPFVVSAVSRVTGVSEHDLLAQQDMLRLRFGELCAINAIARGNTSKAHEIALLRAKGQSWTQVAQSNGVSLATVVQTTRNASDLTANSFTNSAERQKGAQKKLQQMGVRPLSPPGGD
jgi:hypothetical protein